MNPMNPRDLRRPEGNLRVNRPNEPMEEDRYEESYDNQGQTPAAPAKRRSSKGAWILVIAVIIVVVVLGVIFRDRLFGTGGNSASSSGFQAVFLTNGQVYFGKLSDTGDRYATMENIYYLQVTPVLQTKTEGQPGAAATSSQQQQQQLSLVKLGNELHAPVDKMKINRDQILFIEDLKSDGKVVQAIRDYEAGQKK